MTLATPGEFARAFAAGFGARDAEALAALCAPDAEMLTLTGAWCEGRDQIGSVLAAELAGAFARARLVTGKGRLRPIAAGVELLHQRYVLSGLVDAAGNDAGRIGAMLSAVLLQGPAGWHATTLHFAALTG